MRILITNDDGVHAPGIHALALALVEAGRDVVVAAPLDERSGAGAAIGTPFEDGGIQVEELPLLGDVPVYGVAGPPALAVVAARLGAFGDPPDLVVSGINPGNNTGRAVLHSGTVGAALTAANFGISGMAISQDTGRRRATLGGPTESWLVETSAAMAVAALEWLVDAPRRTVLNVNVPNLPMDEIKGVKVGRLAPFGTTRASLAGTDGGRLMLELRPTEEALALDTDTMLVLGGWVSVTNLVGVRAAPDQPQPSALEALLTAAAR